MSESSLFFLISLKMLAISNSYFREENLQLFSFLNFQFFKFLKLKQPFLVVIFFVVLFTADTKAQFVEIGGFGGVLSFNGDVNEGAILPNTNAGFGGFVRYSPHSRFGIKLGVVSGKLEANDRVSQYPHIRERNLSFESSLSEISLIGEFNILPFFPLKPAQVFAPYLGLGLAVVFFNPKTKYQGEWVDLQPVGTEGQGLSGYSKPYDLVGVAIPLVFGFKYSIGGRINIGLEIGYRFTFTDYIDDVSQVYLSPRVLGGNGDLAIALSNRTEEYTGVSADDRIGSRRGNSNNNDAYLVWGVQLSFNIFPKKGYKKSKVPYKINKWF
jgi:hypothetical protein